MTDSYDPTRRRAVVGTLGLAGFAILWPLAAATPPQTEGQGFSAASPSAASTGWVMEGSGTKARVGREWPLF